MLTPERIKFLKTHINLLSHNEKLEALDEISRYEAEQVKKIGQTDLLSFADHVYPGYKVGPHHRRLANIFEEIAAGKKKRVIVNIAPRHGKSELISYLAPAWFLGKYPHKKVIMASHTADLAIQFGRRVRNLVGSDNYHDIFPQIELQADSKSAQRWGTNFGGEYFAIGVGGALAGRGAHLIIADDPHSEQDLKSSNFTSLDATYEWFTAGLRTRLMPEGKICVLHTRWHLRDLIGRLTKDSAMNEDGDKYEIFEFPAILNENTEEEKSIWPEQWSLEALQKTRASMHHIMWQWYAQYQQNPTASEAAIIKRDWIQWWKETDPPEVDFIVQSYDTALTTKERSDFSVCQTWGVFKDKKGVDNVILLNSVRNKYEFPELKVMALEQAQEWEPDSVIVEAKASGQPLIDEMRRSGIFVQDFSPGKGQDKIARLNAVADMFASGQVWFPETSWASTVVEELLAFPAGEHDDTVDACTLALMRVRKGGMMRLVTDQAEEPFYRSRRVAYY